MDLKIALAGNPNAGKTTLFNALTGSRQFVGNWPGVTVEKKEGRLKKFEGVTITDLPGIYSLSPYTLEEVVARNYLIEERPDAILNIVDGTNLERNLYLTTQLVELGIPVVIAINMMDVVRKNGDSIQMGELSRKLGCKIVEISALREEGVEEAAAAAVEAAKNGKTVPSHTFSGPVEHAIAHIEEAVLHDLPEERQRWFAIKIFEHDEKVLEQLHIPEEKLAHINRDIEHAEQELDDDAESIITNERYIYISDLLKGVYRKKSTGGLTTSDKIDRIVTNRWLGLPIFAVVMFVIYYLAMVTVGSAATDWANDGLFGEGFHLFGGGSAQYAEATDTYNAACVAVKAYLNVDVDSEDFDPKAALDQIRAYRGSSPVVTTTVEDEETLERREIAVFYDTVPAGAGEDVNPLSYLEAVAYFELHGFDAPNPADYGTWIPGVPVVLEGLLDRLNVADWLKSLILNGIVAGVGAVLGFVPQLLVLFFLLAFVEASGYMARVAFVLDRIFRRFGLSGKSFIPILVGTGCGIPGIMASRTIENQRDRRMTIMTTTFIPCSAKTPFIAMIAGALFPGHRALVAVGAYFIGMAAIVCSGVILKKTKLFAGDPAPFVMELPAYHWPMLSNVLRSMWERGWSFIKKAGTIILLSTIVIWFLTYSGRNADGTIVIGQLTDEEISGSFLAMVGGAVSWLFAPLGWGNWQAAVASITGLVAKENIVGTMNILYGGGEASTWAVLATQFTAAAGMSFLIFNLLCAPCFAAMGAIRREMNSGKWTMIAIGYECGFAYVISFIVYQLWSMFQGQGSVIGTVLALAVLAALLWLMFRRPANQSETAGRPEAA